jgi:hypothetical protein
MSERKDEKWLDDQLRRAVDGATPVFDAQAWRQKYAGEFQTLLRHRERPGQFGTVRLVLRGSIGKLAIAAVLMAAAGILLVGRSGFTPEKPTPGPQPVAQQSPAQMVSMISLSAAFRSGGMAELDRQCERALERLGPRPISVSMQELLQDINGTGQERANL